MGISNEQDMGSCSQVTYSLVHRNSYNQWSEEGSNIKYLEPGLGKFFSSFCEMIDYG